MKKENLEVWKDVEGYEGLYRVSNLGNIFSAWKKKNKSPRKGNNKYMVVDLFRNNKQTTFLVHRLVALAFCEKTEGKNVVNHIDFNRYNNTASNLEWVTAKENIAHSMANINAARFKKSVKKIDKKTGCVVDIYPSISEAAKQHRVCISSISNAIIGTSKSSGGYLWKFM